ncbi:hypothetical protein [Dyella psychrodurans]|uniref:hypothetical protein n=1 Tax=Dyella psychrodurans TaxID=1927960 RepID=UPI0011C04B0A|nr:hypothetical protein [Dyella psychrodurans]
MKLMKVIGVVTACLLLSSCLPPVYESLPESNNTAALFLSGHSTYSSVGQIYSNAQTCAGRKWVYGGIAGAPKWINVNGGLPVTISISVGTGTTVVGSNIVNHTCTAMATFTPTSGKRYMAQAITADGISRCGMVVNEVGPDGQDAGRVAVTQRLFKLAETEHSSWCKPLQAP